MKISALTKGSIDHVIDNLSRGSREEMISFGLTETELKQKFNREIGDTFTASFLDDDGEPCAITFLEVLGSKKWRTHLCSTDEGLEKIGTRLTIFIKNFLNHMVERGHEFEVLTSGNYKKGVGWVETMGFVFKEKDGNISRFVKKR